jgi:hypothetical protein
MIDTKREKLTRVTVVKQTKVTGADVDPGTVLEVPANITEMDARRLVHRGIAIAGDGTGNAEPYVKKAVADHKAAVSARAAQREQLKPVSNRELMNAIVEQNKILLELLQVQGGGSKKPGKAGD